MAEQQRVSGFFDSYAADFDAIYGNRHAMVNRWVNKYLRKSMRLRFEKTIAGCDPIAGRSVVDIGCGPGHFSIELARRGATHVFGLDFADGMLDVARKHAEAAGVAGRCTWAKGDFTTWPFDRTYDYAIVMGFMDYVQDPDAVIKKTLSITTGRAFFSMPRAEGFLAWQRRLRYRRRCELYLYTEPQVRRLFAGATDRRVEIEPIARDMFVTVHAGR
ncbi:MAG TPA: methyltransferase domain-containing protein [Candidatus Krumholzibacteria bacterium]